MRLFWQGDWVCRLLIVLCLSLVGLEMTLAQVEASETIDSKPDSKPKREFGYRSPVIQKMIFGDELGMLDKEREEYATSLAHHVAAKVSDGKASAQAISFARKCIGLCLQLSPRNKRAMVIDYQLRNSIMPKSDYSGYSNEALSRLLVSRAEALLKQKGEQNTLLSRCFIELAAQIDPRNEDAVYAYEIQRIESRGVIWEEITDARK